ncbi:MAG: hypothetical protein U5N56_02340 [Candidatus Marinimicrobia bacterium]|nr:hypothetical protein [Candidatus Neomarinimicrobiota bacterium]
MRVVVNDRLENAPNLFWISRAAMDSLEVYSLYPTEVLYTIPGKDLPPQTASLHSQLFASLSPNAEIPGEIPIFRLTAKKAFPHQQRNFSACRSIPQINAVIHSFFHADCRIILTI